MKSLIVPMNYIRKYLPIVTMFCIADATIWSTKSIHADLEGNACFKIHCKNLNDSWVLTHGIFPIFICRDGYFTTENDSYKHMLTFDKNQSNCPIKLTNVQPSDDGLFELKDYRNKCSTYLYLNKTDNNNNKGANTQQERKENFTTEPPFNSTAGGIHLQRSAMTPVVLYLSDNTKYWITGVSVVVLVLIGFLAVDFYRKKKAVADIKPCVEVDIREVMNPETVNEQEKPVNDEAVPMKSLKERDEQRDDVEKTSIY